MIGSEVKEAVVVVVVKDGDDGIYVLEKAGGRWSEVKEVVGVEDGEDGDDGIYMFEKAGGRG